MPSSLSIKIGGHWIPHPGWSGRRLIYLFGLLAYHILLIREMNNTYAHTHTHGLVGWPPRQYHFRIIKLSSQSRLLFQPHQKNYTCPQYNYGSLPLILAEAKAGSPNLGSFVCSKTTRRDYLPFGFMSPFRDGFVFTRGILLMGGTTRFFRFFFLSLYATVCVKSGSTVRWVLCSGLRCPIRDHLVEWFNKTELWSVSVRQCIYSRICV